MTRHSLTLTLTLTLACTGGGSEGHGNLTGFRPDREQPEALGPPPTSQHPREPPSFSPVLADGPDCGSCGRSSSGQCRVVRTGYCPGGPVEVREECEHEVPCVESCCDRFPMDGSIALLRPGKPLYDNAWSDSPNVIARVPKGSRGLVVRVTEIPEDRELVQVKTLGYELPSTCNEALDDLPGVVLAAAAKPRDLKPAPRACAEVVYALGDVEDRDPGIDIGEYPLAFDPAPFADAPVIKAWTLLYYPGAGEESYSIAGTPIEHLALPEGEVLEQERSRICYRLPGKLRPRVCSAAKYVHNAPF